MEYVLWMIILIAGAIMSVSQKDQKKRHGTASDNEDTPAPDRREEWNRRMRDIFGDLPTAPPVPTAPHYPQPVGKQGIDPAHPLARAAKRESAATEKVTAERVAAAPKPQKHKTAAKTVGSDKAQACPAEPKAAVGNTDYGRMIDEFDLERAVIYSEILKPKFEEY